MKHQRQRPLTRTPTNRYIVAKVSGHNAIRGTREISVGRVRLRDLDGGEDVENHILVRVQQCQALVERLLAQLRSVVQQASLHRGDNSMT